MEPEHLEAEGAHLGRGRTWLALGVVLTVVVGLVVLRLGRPGADVPPDPVPTPAATSPASSQAWPTDLPAGSLFVGSAGRVYVVASRDGALTRTRVVAYSSETSMTPLAGGVLVQTGSLPRAVVTVAGTVLPARGGLRSGTAFRPGPEGSVWARAPLTPGDRGSRSTWRRVDADGRASTSVGLDGFAVSDGAGGLLDVTEQGFRAVYPAPRGPRQVGDVIATGPTGYVVRACGDTDCRFTLHHRNGDPDSELETAVGDETSAGVLSPTNRLLAVTEQVGGTSTIRVSVVGTGQILDIFPSPGGSTADAVWLDDRWLALISGDRLVLYDATNDRVVTPVLPLSSLGPLAWRPA